MTIGTIARDTYYVNAESLILPHLLEHKGLRMRHTTTALLGAALATACFAPAAFAAGPDGSLVGKWQGKIENYGANDDAREFVVNADGSCQWGYPGKLSKATCDYGPGASVKVTTAAQRPSKVDLTLKDGQLGGSFTLSGQASFYRVAFTRAQGR